ncbi:TetR/AcrR family transcriptional regulator [Curtobacterium sp. VKM Ac-1376]|uniref:TetR/AcrR family transcriptional regulator n=1 Tax=Curtobacterium sp. VKM Ac-1376 TaxID=123312 RepID=UPI00188A806B|nr:TetR/AcrR family transcriptional regulator [Curtobacterium sp. VKM Ac-1376]MBF4616427.1 TetR/AcrR family transcriptional regulator [Curtobacterium sp. VKM Ac-1376]
MTDATAESPRAGAIGGRRERKKAATRAAISSAALELFLAHGFDAVSVRDIAEHADVAVATVFAHFSGKEALVFDEGDAMERALVAAVTNRSAGVDPLTAIEQWFRSGPAAMSVRGATPEFATFQRLVTETPPLRAHWKDMWRQSAQPLADAIVKTSSIDATTARLLATLTIEGYLESTTDDHPDHTLATLFQILRSGIASPALMPPDR